MGLVCSSMRKPLQGADKYEYLGELGSDRKGEFRLMKNRKTKEHVAVRYVSRELGMGLTKFTEREIINHRRLVHPNIIGFKEVFYDDTSLAIVMEYASGGTLDNCLRLRTSLPEEDARRLFCQLIAGVEYCHSQAVMHRDLRPEHILLDGSVKWPTLKITAFHYSKNKVLDSMAKSKVGVPTFAAPEVILAGVDGYNGEAVDCWSCGLILFMMLTGRYPFLDPSQCRWAEQGTPSVLTRQMQGSLTRGEIFWPKGRLSDSAEDLLRQMLQPDPAQRATIQQIKQHEWVSKETSSSPYRMGKMSSQTDIQICDVVNAACIRPSSRRDHLATVPRHHKSVSSP